MAERQERNCCAPAVGYGQADMEIKPKSPQVFSSLFSEYSRQLFRSSCSWCCFGSAVFTLGLNTASHYANERVQEDLGRNSREIYDLCDSALQGLLLDGHGDNEAAIRILKEVTLGKVEEYASKNNLQVIVYKNDASNILLSSTVIDEKEAHSGDTQRAASQ